MGYRGRHRPRGFSEKPVKPAWDLMLGGLGVEGREKRRFFNDLSLKIAAAAGLATCIITTVAAGGAAFALAAHVLVKDRYFRP